MNRKRTGWLLPTAVCSYVALGALGDNNQDPLRLGLLVVPALLALSLIRLDRIEETPFLDTARTPLRLLAMGSALFLCASFAPPDNSFLRAAGGVGQALVTVAALLAVARVEGPRGLLPTPRAAKSLDAVVMALVLWSIVTFLVISRTILPEISDVDPPSIDTALLFSSLGSLLLLSASLTRARLLRGLQLGVADRTSAGLALAIAGTSIGAGSGLLRTATADRVSGITLVLTASAIIWCCAERSPSRVARMTRGALALVLLGAPTALLGAWLALQFPQHPTTIALGLAASSMAVGVVSFRVARPLGPAGSRWIDALTQAMSAALHPEPDLALRAALSALQRAERTSTARPELFRYDPASLLSVDIAGYLTERDVDFPEKVYALALEEPGHTLRKETVVAAQVRRPDVRPLVGWFSAHGAKSATALSDAEGPVGLLALPEGKRSSPLITEEVELLGDLGERMTGILSVTSALARAHRGQLQAERQAAVAAEQARALGSQLEDQSETGRAEAERLSEAVRRTAHGPAAQMALSEIERQASCRVIYLETPPGADAAAWAAYAHLCREQAQAFVVVDCTDPLARDPSYWAEQRTASPFTRARAGTLVALGAGGLAEPAREALAKAFLSCTEVHLVLSSHIFPLHQQLQGPSVQLPAIEDRAEDLQSLILFEASRIGLHLRGTPFGVARPALSLLLDRSFPGNEAELRGLLTAACARCPSDTLSVGDLEAALALPETGEPPPVGLATTPPERRRRNRPPPRARRG